MRSRQKKLSAFFTAFCFFLNPFSFVPAVRSQAISEIEIVTPGFQLLIPPELGSVEMRTKGQGPAVVHIQTAHGHYEAQKNIQAILHHLKNAYGFDFLLLEGGAVKLDPALLEFFPDRKDLTMKMADELAKEALVKGDELFLLEDPAAEAYGIENIEAYQKNREAFKAVLTQKEKTEGFLREMQMQIERLAARYLNKELRGFLRGLAVRGYCNTPLHLDCLTDLKQQAQKHLALDLTDPQNQFDWPMLLRFFKIQELEPKVDQKILVKERDQFLKAIRPFAGARSPHPGAKGGVTLPLYTFHQIQHLLSSLLGRHSLPADPETSILFEEMVRALPQDFNYEVFPNVKYAIGYLIFQSELKSGQLRKEAAVLTEKISGKLATSDKAKKILVLLRIFDLLKRLFALELTPEDYEEIQNREGKMRPANVAEQFLEINRTGRVKNIEFAHLDEIEAFFDMAVEFYRGARERDRWMLQNIESRLKETGRDKAVVITGGFHAEPFRRHFEGLGYNYVLITPRMTSGEGREKYLQVMLEDSYPPSKSTVESSRLSDPVLGLESGWARERIETFRRKILKEAAKPVRGGPPRIPLPRSEARHEDSGQVPDLAEAIEHAVAQAGDQFGMPHTEKAQAAYQKILAAVDADAQQPGPWNLSLNGFLPYLMAEVFGRSNYKAVLHFFETVGENRPDMFREGLLRMPSFILIYLFAHLMNSESIEAAGRQKIPFLQYCLQGLGPEFDPKKFYPETDSSRPEWGNLLASVESFYFEKINYLARMGDFGRAAGEPDYDEAFRLIENYRQMLNGDAADPELSPDMARLREQRKNRFLWELSRLEQDAESAKKRNKSRKLGPKEKPPFDKLRVERLPRDQEFALAVQNLDRSKPDDLAMMYLIRLAVLNKRPALLESEDVTNKDLIRFLYSILFRFQEPAIEFALQRLFSFSDQNNEQLRFPGFVRRARELVTHAAAAASIFPLQLDVQRLTVSGASNAHMNRKIGDTVAQLGSPDAYKRQAAREYLSGIQPGFAARVREAVSAIGTGSAEIRQDVQAVLEALAENEKYTGRDLSSIVEAEINTDLTFLENLEVLILQLLMDVEPMDAFTREKLDYLNILKRAIRRLLNPKRFQEKPIADLARKLRAKITTAPLEMQQPYIAALIEKFTALRDAVAPLRDEELFKSPARVEPISKEKLFGRVSDQIAARLNLASEESIILPASFAVEIVDEIFNHTSGNAALRRSTILSALKRVVRQRGLEFVAVIVRGGVHFFVSLAVVFAKAGRGGLERSEMRAAAVFPAIPKMEIEKLPGFIWDARTRNFLGLSEGIIPRRWMDRFGKDFFRTRSEVRTEPLDNLVFKGITAHALDVIEGQIETWEPEEKKLNISLVNPNDSPEVNVTRIHNEIRTVTELWQKLRREFAGQAEFQVDLATADGLIFMAQSYINANGQKAEHVLQESLGRYQKPSQTLQIMINRLIEAIKDRESLFALELTENGDETIKQQIINRQKELLMIRIFDIFLNLPYGFNTTEPSMIREEKELAEARRQGFLTSIPDLVQLIENGKTVLRALKPVIEKLEKFIRVLEPGVEDAKQKIEQDPENAQLQQNYIFKQKSMATIQEQINYLQAIAGQFDTYDFIYDLSEAEEEKEAKQAEESRRHKKILDATLKYFPELSGLLLKVKEQFEPFLNTEIQKGRPIEYGTVKFFYKYYEKYSLTRQSDAAEPEVIDFLMRFYDIAKHGDQERESDNDLIVFAKKIRHEMDYAQLFSSLRGKGRVRAIISPKEEGEYRIRHVDIFAQKSGILVVSFLDLQEHHLQFSDIHKGDIAMVDGKTGKVVINPSEQTRGEWLKNGKIYRHLNNYFLSRAGMPVRFEGKEIKYFYDETSIGAFRDRPDGSVVSKRGGSGVKLFRLEEIMVGELDRQGIELDEARLRLAISDILTQSFFADHPVVFRLFDVEPDKRTKFLVQDGWDLDYVLTHLTGARFYLTGEEKYQAFREFGKKQLRAIFGARLHKGARASEVGILFPDVRNASEVAAIEELMEEAKGEFIFQMYYDPEFRESLAVDVVEAVQIINAMPVGYMLEHTYVVETQREKMMQAIQELRVERQKKLGTAEPAPRFIGIGANDLTKSITEGRMHGKGSPNVLNSYLIRDIWSIATSAKKYGLEVNLEGEWGSSIRMLLVLLALRELEGLEIMPVAGVNRVPELLEHTRNITRNDLKTGIRQLEDPKAREPSPRFEDLIVRAILDMDPPTPEELENVSHRLVTVVYDRISASTEFNEFVDAEEEGRPQQRRSELRRREKVSDDTAGLAARQWLSRLSLVKDGSQSLIFDITGEKQKNVRVMLQALARPGILEKLGQVIFNQENRDGAVRSLIGRRLTGLVSFRFSTGFVPERVRSFLSGGQNVVPVISNRALDLRDNPWAVQIKVTDIEGKADPNLEFSEMLLRQVVGLLLGNDLQSADELRDPVRGEKIRSELRKALFQEYEDRENVLQFDANGNPVISRRALRRYLTGYLARQSMTSSA